VLTKHLTGRFLTKPADDAVAKATRKLRAAIQERDAAIAQLEKRISEHETHVESLRLELEQSGFKAQTLEQSYSTQLAEARERARMAEESIIEQQTRIVELEADYKITRRKLDDAQARLDMFGPEAASIDEMLASFSIPRERPGMFDGEAPDDAPVEPQSLEEMLAPDVMFSAKQKQ
jgi:chromosome segregation ATPase